MRFDVDPLPGFAESYGVLCAILQDGTREWRWEIDPSLSVDAVVWQPEPGMHSIGGILLHIAAVEVFWFEQFVLGQPPNPQEQALLLNAETNVDEWRWPTPPRKTLSWYFELHDRIRERSIEGIRRWPPADSEKELDGHPRTMGWVLGHVIQHEAYHGGQAVLLSRLWELRKLTA